MRDHANNYVGAMLTWSIITEKVKLDEETDRLRQMVVQILFCQLEPAIDLQRTAEALGQQTHQQQGQLPPLMVVRHGGPAFRPLQFRLEKQQEMTQRSVQPDKCRQPRQ